jgi:membrane protein YdbS with pleckstrin-like domain
MRDKPTLRIPFGILGLVAALLVYVLLVAKASDWISDWPILVQTIAYIVLGTIWLLPLKRFLVWMETGSWRIPPQE